MVQDKKAIIIGAGIAGPVLALQLQKIGIVADVYEARKDRLGKEGTFLGITPNGLNILKEFIDLETLKKHYTPGHMHFYNAKGKQIGALPTTYQLEKYGAETIQIIRAELCEAVRKKALENGISIHFGKELDQFQESEKSVKALFTDGTTAQGDFMIACDGVFSTVRRKLFPNAPRQRYTKNISIGGYAQLPGLNDRFGAIHMTFGTIAFFAYAVSNQNEVWWFSNFFREQEPSRESSQTLLQQEIKDHLLKIHHDDDPLFSEIIENSYELLAYPVYDMPPLPKWYSHRVCLMGDAAHATSPHIGQGASMALEDTKVLANCLTNHAELQTAFQHFQDIRKPRVEKIVKHSRKVGSNKSKPNPIATWFRDRLLQYFVQGEVKKLDWVYGFKA